MVAVTSTVYPRTCGGTRQSLQVTRSHDGLSPHVRGNPQEPGQRVYCLGSIPARAGEPSLQRSVTLTARVYPRTCGGTPGRSVTAFCGRGLSPHVRGNRGRLTTVALPPRSIPARAGEPGLDRERSQNDGGLCGLSPHVRGNLTPYTSCSTPRGSIPARAGEPPRAGPQGAGARVYPRTCGGTSGATWPETTGKGLSPHVRGNRRYPARAAVP